MLAVLIVTTGIWVGGYVAIAVVARMATATASLGPAEPVVFFRVLGRTYLWVGLPVLALALLTGAVLGLLSIALVVLGAFLAT